MLTIGYYFVTQVFNHTLGIYGVPVESQGPFTTRQGLIVTAHNVQGTTHTKPSVETVFIQGQGSAIKGHSLFRFAYHYLSIALTDKLEYFHYPLLFCFPS
jgi:hypothetical protein